MIWLSRKDEFKRMLLTLNAQSLDYTGPFLFITKEKKIVKLREAELPVFCLYLSADKEGYGSTLAVPKSRYDKAREGTPYGMCGVIKNIGHGDFFIITENTEPGAAIRQAVKRAWGEMLFIIFVCCLFLLSVLIFLVPLLRSVPA
jgi:hypothetical protein